MRVAQVLPVFYRDQLDFKGGGDRYAYQLARALRPYCDVTFFTFGPRYRETERDGLRHVVLPGGGGNPHNPTPRALAFAARGFDIVHAHQLRTTVTSLAAVLRRAVRKPLVVTDLGGGGKSLTFRLRLYRWIDRFVCISDFSKSLLPVAARSKAVVIKGGIELERFPYHAGTRERQVVAQHVHDVEVVEQPVLHEGVDGQPHVSPPARSVRRRSGSRPGAARRACYEARMPSPTNGLSPMNDPRDPRPRRSAATRC